MRFKLGILVSFLSLLIAGCDGRKMFADTKSEVISTEPDVSKAEVSQTSRTDEKPSKQPAESNVSGLADYDPPPVLSEASPAQSGEQSLCWQDYCPCEPGQDGQGAEASLCRNLKGGVHVDDDIMAAAAMMRDARRELREFNETEGTFE